MWRTVLFTLAIVAGSVAALLAIFLPAAISDMNKTIKAHRRDRYLAAENIVLVQRKYYSMYGTASEQFDIWTLDMPNVLLLGPIQTDAKIFCRSEKWLAWLGSRWFVRRFYAGHPADYADIEMEVLGTAHEAAALTPEDLLDSASRLLKNTTITMTVVRVE